MSFNTKDFRAELLKLMPGYSWVVHLPRKKFLPTDLRAGAPDVLVATGIQSSGSNRLSTLEVTRRDKDGTISYEAKSAGYGTRARFLHAHTDGTLPRALRGLQDHYEHTAATYRSHAHALQSGRIAKGGNTA